MRKLLRMLQKDENTISIGRFTAVLAFVLKHGLYMKHSAWLWWLLF